MRAPLSSKDTLVGDKDKYLFDGVYLNVENDWNIKIDTAATKWNKTHSKKDYILSFGTFTLANVSEKGIAYPSDYNLVFDASHTPADTSTSLTITYNNNPYHIPKVNSNFRIYDPSTGKQISYAYLDAGIKGMFSSLDRIIFIQKTKTPAGKDTTIITWLLQTSGSDTASYTPTSGDTLRLRVTKPFTNQDVLEITTKSAKVENNLAT
ncbi:MAG: hypothetical protein P8Z35_06880, partial [Ignavibacteriaceae bacterium]